MLWLFIASIIIVVFLLVMSSKNEHKMRLARLELLCEHLNVRLEKIEEKLGIKGENSPAPNSAKPQTNESAKPLLATYMAQKGWASNKATPSANQTQNDNVVLTLSSKNAPNAKLNASHENFAKISTSNLNANTPSQPNSATNSPFISNLNTNTLSFERFFTQKAMVILGGIFFVLAAFFCIKYSIEHNLLTPRVRIGLAMGFGALLFIVGFGFERLKGLNLQEKNENSASNSPNLVLNSTPNPHQNAFIRLFLAFSSKLNFDKSLLNRISQTCVGAFVVVEFFSIYGGYVLYEFFGANLSFVLLCAVSFLALFLTLRFGFVAGFFGLFGGFSTPILIDTGIANFYMLCGYLCALHLSVLYISYKRNKLILPLLSSAFMLVYLFLFVEDGLLIVTDAYFIAFILCVVIFLSLIFLAMRLFTEQIDDTLGAKILFLIVLLLAFAVFLHLSQPRQALSNTHSFAFIAILCVISLVLPFFARYANVPLFARFLSQKFKANALANERVFDYAIIFALLQVGAYLCAFALPNFVFYAFLGIFIIGIALNLVLSGYKIFYLYALLCSGGLFALIEFIQSGNFIAIALCALLCVCIYAIICAKNLAQNTAQNLLALNAVAFFAALFLLAHNLPFAHSAVFYMYLCCGLWALASALLSVLNSDLARQISPKMRPVPEFIIINAVFLVLAFIFFLSLNAPNFFYTLFLSDLSATLQIWGDLLIFMLISGVHLVLWVKFTPKNLNDKANTAPNSNAHSNQSANLSEIISQNSTSSLFYRFCLVFFTCIFGAFALSFIDMLNAFIATTLQINEMLATDELYLMQGGVIFGLLGLLCAKMFAKFGTQFGSNLKINPLKIAFYVLCAKALWLFVLALYGARHLFTANFITPLSNEVDSWLVWAWCLPALAFAGFFVVFALNERLIAFQTFSHKFAFFIVDFIAIALLVFGVIYGVHFAFGVGVDFGFDEGLITHKFRLNSANELYAYSAMLVCASFALLALGIWREKERLKHYCFALLFVVALKVFFVDTSSFSTLGKIALFVFMGVAFIGVAMIYSKFVLKRNELNTKNS